MRTQEEIIARYSSVGHIAFTLEHASPDPTQTHLDLIRAALMRRIADLDEAQEWGMGVSFDDTVEED